jgi:methylphosphotriester-DNA--protein-cysteine methyltransferase
MDRSDAETQWLACQTCSSDEPGRTVVWIEHSESTADGTQAIPCPRCETGLSVKDAVNAVSLSTVTDGTGEL